MPARLPSAAGSGSDPGAFAPAWLVHARPEVLHGLTRTAARALAAPVALLYLEDEGASARVISHFGLAHGAAIPDELCLHVAAAGEPLALRNARADLRWRRVLQPGTEEVAAFAAVPLPVVAGTRGVLAVLDFRPRDWEEADIDTLADLAAAAAAELDRARTEAERTVLQAALQHSDVRYCRLTRTSLNLIYVLDAEGIVIEANPAAERILGLPVSELLGCSFRSVVAPEDLELAERVFAEQLAGGAGEVDLEIRLLRPTGERRLMQLSVSAVVEAGRTVSVHGVGRDITDERAEAMQSRRAERMANVGPLLSGVCHELNNPLTSIKSFAELLLLDERSPEDQEALEIVCREAHRAAKIVSDLRVVARQSQAMGAGREQVDLGVAASQALQVHQASLAGSGIVVRAELEEGLPAMWGVRSQIDEVAWQLISNAAQAMRHQAEPRELTLRAYRGGIGVVLQVEDTGPGILPEHLDRIFDPFWTTRRAGEGTGLGLSLVQSIVTDHSGRVRVSSVPGRGTSFIVEFPVATQPAVTQSQVDVEASSGRSLRILVVDDEVAIRHSLLRYLERRGHEVRDAAEGAAALRLLEAEEASRPFDVVVADLRMPGLNGGELVRRLRERGDGMHERVIFITGDSDCSDLDGEVTTEGIPVVHKPFELAEIAQIIEAHASIVGLP